MENNLAIKVSGLSKRYSISGNKIGIRFSERLKDLFKTFSGKSRKKDEYFYALKDINFEIKTGEAVGIIGRNGAGKSTLLKILSEVTEPTEGSIEINGKVASVLEVGMGFHPELTGRENVFLSGTMLGISKKDIENKFNAIVEFSGVEKFIDTPVKHYSSGMYVRLAFSVVANIDADILIFDEVLSIGDNEFQQKCQRKIAELIKSRVSIIMVSHNMNDILHNCNQVILLEKGEIVSNGSSNLTVFSYLEKIDHKYLTSNKNSLEENILQDINASLKKYGFEIKAIEIHQDKIKKSGTILIDFPFYINMHIIKTNNAYKLNLNYNFIHLGNVFLSTSTLNTQSEIMHIKEKGDYSIDVKVPDHFLNTSSYEIDVFVSCEETDEIFKIKSAINFQVEEGNYSSQHRIYKVMSKFPGPMNPSFLWTINYERN
jgi:lipopolysaccharide transport system ATP-binding protein